MTDNEYQTITLERVERVAVLTLNRPDALNALNAALMAETVAALTELDRDPNVGAIVITGSDRAFAAGADIKEMAPQAYMDVYKADLFGALERRCRPFASQSSPRWPAIALGGGCELAMLCDFIIAADTAKFGQPEINLGVMPGIGGTQRLTRYVGKSKAMEMCLTGRMMDAAEAERAGLVSRVVARRQADGRSHGRRAEDRRHVAPDRDDDQGKRSTPPTRPRCARASPSSEGCSTRFSPPPTRKKAWPPSSRSGSRSSSMARPYRVASSGERHHRTTASSDVQWPRCIEDFLDANLDDRSAPANRADQRATHARCQQVSRQLLSRTCC